MELERSSNCFYLIYCNVIACFSDPHIKVAGLPDSVRLAKEKVMAVLDTKVY